MSPSVHRVAHRNMSAPSSPVHVEKLESRTFGSHSNGGDTFHRQQPSLPHAEIIRGHISLSDNVGVRYADKRSDTIRDSGYSDLSRVDHEYSDYAYVRASAVNHPRMKDVALDYRAGSGRGAGVVPDGIYSQRHWPDHQADRSREVGGQRQTDANLYHIASNRTMSYASSDELPVTAAATTSRFLDPATHWPTKHGSLEAGFRRQNGDTRNTNLSSGCLYVGSSHYAGSETNLPDRSHDPMPRRLASPPVHYETPPHVRAAAADAFGDSVELSPADSSTVFLRGQNYLEVSKPFEMSDVYKYSARMRRTVEVGRCEQTADLRSSSSPHLTGHAREPQHRDQRPAYIASNPQYFPSRHYQKPVFD